MVVQEKLISVSEFWELVHDPDFADKSLELEQGVLVVMSRPGAEHGFTQGETYLHVRLFVGEHDLGYVTVESGYVLFQNPDGRDTVRGPDVAFVSKTRLPGGLPEGYIPFAPDLAVEVVSPNDVLYDLEKKVGEYLHAGTKLVWMISPHMKTVIAYRQDGVTAYDLNGTLDGGDVLPGFKLPVAAMSAMGWRR
jgi:Uma2 family endonuclease